MAGNIEAQLATALRRESAFAGVLNAVARGGDLDSVLTEIAYWAAPRTVRSASRAEPSAPRSIPSFTDLGRPVPIVEITALR